MKPASAKTLATLRKRLSEADLRALFADIRAASDAELLGAPKGEGGDPLVTAVTALLAPSSESSAAKGRLLVAELARLTGRALPVKPRGLPDAVRKLRAYLSEDDIRDGAFSVRVTLQAAPASKSTKKKDP
jgi:hypothetical protein